MATAPSTPPIGESPEILFHLRWVAKIALWIGVVAAAGLGTMLYALTDTTGESYGALIKSHSIAQYRLGPALLIGGFFLIAFSALLTWLITLYSSFRIAGPLYRLSRNLENSISQEPAKLTPIRDSDRLQQEATMLREGLSALASHYAGLREQVDQAIMKLDADEVSLDERHFIFDGLKKQLEHARV